MGVNGSKAEAVAFKTWIKEYLKKELDLDLNETKTLVTNAKKRVRFLGYDIKRWKGTRHLRFRHSGRVRTQRTSSYHLALLLPHEKLVGFGRKYGNPAQWRGKARVELQHMSELEILMHYNAETRGFLGYYSLADNLKLEGNRLLNIARTSFLHTLARKRRSTVTKTALSMKRGQGRYVLTLRKEGKEVNKEYELLASTRQLQKGKVHYEEEIDQLPNLKKYYARSELSQRLLAERCEWCGQEGQEAHIEVHHVRKVKDLKGKTLWERVMIERKRKTLILCRKCHDELHAGLLNEKNRLVVEEAV